MPKIKTRPPPAPTTPCCEFCTFGAEVSGVAGQLWTTMKGGSLTAHHKCMQYSSGLGQYTGPAFAHFGYFDPAEVRQELRRGRQLRCALCRARGGSGGSASSGCALAACPLTFHFLCAVQDPNESPALVRNIRTKEEDGGWLNEYVVFCKEAHKTAYEAHKEGEEFWYVDSSNEAELPSLGMSPCKRGASVVEGDEKKRNAKVNTRAVGTSESVQARRSPRNGAVAVGGGKNKRKKDETSSSEDESDESDSEKSKSLKPSQNGSTKKSMSESPSRRARRSLRKPTVGTQVVSASESPQQRRSPRKATVAATRAPEAVAEAGKNKRKKDKTSSSEDESDGSVEEENSKSSKPSQNGFKTSHDLAKSSRRRSKSSDKSKPFVASSRSNGQPSASAGAKSQNKTEKKLGKRRDTEKVNGKGKEAVVKSDGKGH